MIKKQLNDKGIENLVPQILFLKTQVEVIVWQLRIKAVFPWGWY